MDDLQKIWGSISVKEMTDTEIDNLLEQKTKGVISKFTMTLKYERIIFLIVLLLSLLTYIIKENNIFALIAIITSFNFVINYIASISLKRLTITDEISSFIKKSLSYIKLYIRLYIVFCFATIIVVMLFVKKIYYSNISFVKWVTMSDFIWVIILSVFILSILTLYMYKQYKTRSKKLKTYLEQIN